MRVPLVCTAALLAACGGSDAMKPKRADSDWFPKEPEIGEPVKVELVSNAGQVAPGGEIELGIRFSIRPGWKIYWSNPGESGKPTLARFELPAGVTAGELRYPGPTSFAGLQQMVSYGYEGEVLLTAPVQVDATLAAGTEVTLAAEVSWAACEDRCVLGRKRLELTLPVVADASAVTPAYGELFARYRPRLPVPLDDQACSVEMKPGDGQVGHEVVISCDGAETLEFFPDGANGKALGAQLSMPVGEGARLRLTYEPGADVESVRGVLRAGDRYYAIDRSLR